VDGLSHGGIEAGCSVSGNGTGQEDEQNKGGNCHQTDLDSVVQCPVLKQHVKDRKAPPQSSGIDSGTHSAKQVLGRYRR